MSGQRTKSGMGTDVDPVRAVLLIAIFFLVYEASSAKTTSLVIGAVIAAVAAAVLLGWWVTRAWYLDQIDAMKARMVEPKREDESS